MVSGLATFSMVMGSGKDSSPNSSLVNGETASLKDTEFE